MSPNTKSSIADCSLYNLKKINDPRGNLTAIEGESDVPFKIARVYYLYDVPAGAHRGGHAHKQLHQLLVAVAGSFDVIICDGRQQRRFHLTSPYVGLYICPYIWRELKNFSSGSVCFVLASNNYYEEDYIRDFKIFLETKGIL